ncbi:MAG: oligosaccharide flippase family protein [Anaerolineaceae bacterium]|nr:MAG: oligosaccharide flippase family protein [Anaerolineaceae bacterium]
MSMGQGVLAARLLGVEGAGYVGIITQFSSNINRLTSFRMGELVISYVGEFSANGRRRQAAAVFKAAMLAEITSSLLAFALVVSLSPLGARIFAHNPNLTGLFMFYGLSVLANLMYESGSGLLQFFDQFRMIAYISVGQSVLTLLVIVGAFLLRGGLEMVVFAYLVGKIALALTTSVAALWQARVVWGPDWWRVPLSVLADRRSDLIRFAINTNLSGTLKLITRDSEMLWLGAFSTPLQVGYYKIAKAITNLLMMPVTPLITTTYREVAREVASERWRNVRYLLRSGSILSASWTLPVSLGLVIFGQWVVAIYGREFLPTSYINLLLLLIGVIVVNIFFWNRSVLLPLGMPEYPTKVLFIGAIFKIVGTVLFVPRWGANAMAILLTGFFLFATSVLVWKTLREIRNAELVPAVSIVD